MDGSFIPPPFPYPEAWPKIFAEQQQQKGRWLTPTMFGTAQWPTSTATEDFTYLVDQERVPTIDAQQNADQSYIEGGVGDYEYVYVLSDEWRDRFQSSTRLEQRPQSKNKKHQTKKKQKKKEKVKQRTEAVNARTFFRASLSSHLQDEIQAARSRDLARTRKRRGDVDASLQAAFMNPQIKALETSLDMAFDDFCDTFQPVMWPHDPLKH